MATIGLINGMQKTNAVNRAWRTISTDRTLDTTDEYVIVTAACTVTLPAATGISGRRYCIKNDSAGDLTIVVSGGGTVDGLATTVISATDDAITVMSNGTNWDIVDTFFLAPAPHATVSDSTTQTLSGTAVEHPVLFNTNDEMEFLHDRTIGSTVTITQADPAVITWTAHGLHLNSPVVFSNSGGALPTGITAGTTYYVLAAGLATDSFRISATPSGNTVPAAIATSSAGSGTHTAKSLSCIKVKSKGVYIFSYSILCDTTSAAAATFDFWLELNGTNVTRSNTQVAIANANEQMTMAVTFTISLARNDCVEMYWRGSNANCNLKAIAAVNQSATTPDIPACPSAVLCVSKTSR